MDGLMQLFSIRAGQAHYWRATTMIWAIPLRHSSP